MMHVAGHKERPPIHPQEKWFLCAVLVQLSFMSWAFGTMHAWSQLTSLALSGLGLVLAAWPRHYDADQAIGMMIFAERNEQGAAGKNLHAGFRLNPWPRLMRFPPFWLGLLLLAYLGVQACNPSWVWTRNATSWWLVRVNDTEWLPTSIETPFERFNLWRQFIIYATVWLTMCSLWIGITRRRTLQILLGVLVGNAVILASIGFIHKAGGNVKVLWLTEFPGASSFASFIYQNHAGAYFGIMSFVALGMAVWHFFEGRKRMAKSTPAALWLVAALLLVSGVVFSLSRGAIISVTVFGVAALIAVLILRFTSSIQSTVPTIVPVLVSIGVIGTAGWVASQVDFSHVYFKFKQLTKLQANDPSVLSRQLARDSAVEMLGDHWQRGVGAGGFRYLFPEYIKGKPLIYERGQLFWEHAHNDWLEVPIELGITGTALIVLAFGWVAWFWLQHGGWRHPLVLLVAFGIGQVMVHALMDFPFQNPAILVTWAALGVISLRWLELDGGSAMKKLSGEPRWDAA